MTPERWQELGLKEVPVMGTAFSLLTVGDGSEPTIDQRIEMAKRLNQVGPSLPHYVPSRAGESQNATKEGAATMNDEQKKPDNNEAGAAPATPPNTEEITRAHAKNLKETRKAEKEKAAAAAKKKAEDEAKAKKLKTARKKAKKADVTPKPEHSGKAKAKAAKGKTAAAPKKGHGIGAVVSDLLLKKKSTEDILAAVKKQFPKAKTSPASIAWYRSKLREEGKLKD